ncbi:MAG: hypothetical protein MPK34_05635 [Gammaproteobacteria bacterium]|nr:hypothetical protein [Gammaproteobacteria bacterium]MDA7962295.1 hypothetical protein [Gammaproteobacteria bacterium]MDA8024278.1 hypothetical protein [Gammaproteobacteria bacterium]
MKKLLVLAVLWVLPATEAAAWKWEVYNRGQAIFTCSPATLSDTKLKPPYQNLASQLCFSCSNTTEGLSFLTWVKFTDTYLNSDKAKIWLGSNRGVEIDLTDLVQDDVPEKGRDTFIVGGSQTSLLMQEMHSARQAMLEVSWHTAWWHSLFGGTSVYFNYPMSNYNDALREAKGWCRIQPKN